MGKIFDEAERELEGVLKNRMRRPAAAVVRLLQMALEREEIVSMAYRHSLVSNRLERMQIPEDVRQLIKHAIIWLWKDEEMHAIYARGALWRLGGIWIKSQALIQQMNGMIAGWATSVTHHSNWKSAPFSCLGAKLVMLAGRVIGKVPHELAQQLRSVSFRDFCLLNGELEKASWLSWDRIALLSERLGIVPEMLVDFHRVASDEIRHKLVFQAIAESLAPDDRMVNGRDAKQLSEQIGQVSSHFLPRGFRETDNPIGSGCRVWAVAGSPEETARATFRRTLIESGLAQVLQQRAKSLGKTVNTMRVIVKTCFMLGSHRRDPSPIVAPELIYEMVDFLRESGCSDILIAESRNLYEGFFAGRTVREVAEYFGLKENGFRLVDLSEEQEACDFGRGMGQTTIAAPWRDADFRISLGKVRSHPIELALLGLGNLEGIGGRTDQFLFAERQASRSTALMMILDRFPSHFNVVDCFDNVPDGLVGMMGCPVPKAPRRFYAGIDALAVDGIIGGHLGWRCLEDSALVAAACHWFGGRPSDVELIGIDIPISGWKGPHSNDWQSLLSLLAAPVYEWGSGRGSLFVPLMDQDAFPLRQRPGLLLRCVRGLIRTLIGLRLPRESSAEISQTF